MDILFQTENTYLRNLSESDRDVIFAYRNDSGCAAYQRWEDTSRQAIGGFVKQFENCRFLSEQEEQHYAICTKAHAMAGELSWFYNEEERCITLGITIAPEYQRSGIAREILKSVVKAAQKQYPRMDIVALIHPENRASLALFEQLKFVRECYAPSIDSFVYVIYGDSDTGDGETQK